MGLGAINPGCDCCGGIACAGCSGGRGPSQWQVTIDGIVNDQCTGASGLNGTWILSNVGECLWWYELSSAERTGLQISTGSPAQNCFCRSNIDLVRIKLAIGGLASITVTIELTEPVVTPCTGVNTYIFSVIYQTQVDCLDLVDQGIPFSSQSSVRGYNAAGGTCRITAIL